MDKKWAVIAVLIGAVITYVSAGFPNEYIRVIGARLWGHPIPWLTQAVVAVPPPKEISLLNAVADIAIWSLAAYAIFLVVGKVWSRG